MKVSLVDYTGCGTPDPARHAANVLVFTKSTRLNMTPGLMEVIASMPEHEIEKELKYMANTIPSSWEFVHYSFLIQDVTRGFTHQFVRTRTGSYAQQTMRILNVEGWDYGTGPTIEADTHTDADGNPFAGPIAHTYHRTMQTIADAYGDMVSAGAAIEDARGVLPTNIHTNIVANFSLRTLADIVRKRSSSRTQGEYRLVLDEMKQEVLRVHPWAVMFFDRTFERAAHDLEQMLLLAAARGAIDESQKINGIKLIDQMRGQA